MMIYRDRELKKIKIRWFIWGLEIGVVVTAMCFILLKYLGSLPSLWSV